MYKWLILGATLALLKTGYSDPVHAAYWFIALCVAIEAWIAGLQLTQSVKEMEPNMAPYFLSREELFVLSRYPLLFKYPHTASSIFHGLNFLLIGIMVAVPWLLYTDHWILALALAANFPIISKLGVFLEPRMWHSKMAKAGKPWKSAESQLCIELIQSIFEKTYGRKQGETDNQSSQVMAGRDRKGQ